MNSNIEFIAPEYTFTEILKHTDVIEKKAKLASKDLRYVNRHAIFANNYLPKRRICRLLHAS